MKINLLQVKTQSCFCFVSNTLVYNQRSSPIKWGQGHMILNFLCIIRFQNNLVGKRLKIKRWGQRSGSWALVVRRQDWIMRSWGFRKPWLVRGQSQKWGQRKVSLDFRITCPVRGQSQTVRPKVRIMLFKNNLV